jgi:PiT family inorganic phosphate transporter
MPSIFIWITIFAGAYMAWNIGANDVANAFGTSVGSKAIKMRTATFIAAIFTFAGAYLVGPNVSSTIKGGIVNPEIYTGSEVLYVLGMLTSLVAAAIWVNVSTYLGWPVSTTHSIVGALIGFGIVTKGFGAIQWGETLKIVASWFISPISGAIIASLVFLIIIRTILFAAKPIIAMKKWVPWICGGMIFVIVLSLFYKGLKHLRIMESTEHPDGFTIVGGIGHLAGIPDKFNWCISIAIALVVSAIGIILTALWMRSIKILDDDSSRSQKFKVVEGVFAKLQIASACYVAFAHGSNDVANAIGPVAAVWETFHTHVIQTKAPIPTWLLLAGGFFIGLGICTWGYKVIRTIGEKITGITPTRGFAAEFGAATTVLICSQMGLPISTTHTIVGAVIGVGFARGMKALNLAVVRQIFESWLYTIPFTAVLTVILFYIIKAIFL